MAGMEFDGGCCGAVSDAVWPPFGVRCPDPYLALDEHERRHHALASAAPGSWPTPSRGTGTAPASARPDSTFAHPLVRDVVDGITPAEAELRVRSLLLREPT